jgi:hypothetical protein
MVEIGLDMRLPIPLLARFGMAGASRATPSSVKAERPYSAYQSIDG